jgi:hypothetical protein
MTLEVVVAQRYIPCVGGVFVRKFSDQASHHRIAVLLAAAALTIALLLLLPASTRALPVI